MCTNLFRDVKYIRTRRKILWVGGKWHEKEVYTVSNTFSVPNRNLFDEWSNFVPGTGLYDESIMVTDREDIFKVFLEEGIMNLGKLLTSVPSKN